MVCPPNMKSFYSIIISQLTQRLSRVFAGLVLILVVYTGKNMRKILTDIVFSEEGLVKRQKADGILGLGANTDSICFVF